MEKNGNLGHLELIRKINRTLILNMVKEKQPISRAQISKALNLSKTTVSAIVDELIKKKLLVEYGDCMSPSGVGRPSTMLGFNPKSAYCIGIDIGGTKLLFLITDLVGNIVYEKKLPTKNQFEELVQIVEESLEAAGIKREMIFGMGIGVPGTVDSDGTVVRAKALSWNQFPLQSLMNEYFSFPVYVGNDVNLAALGERWIGSGEQTDDMLFIALGTGIGGALVCGGQLVLGAQGRAGELGYYLDSSDEEKGEINKLGQQGILEKKCSGSALDQIVGSAEALFTAYSRGDTSVIPVIDKFVRDFSVAIANTISLLNPEKVVIGGGVSDSMGSVIQRIREEVGRLTPIQADICLANLGGKAGALGAINFASKKIEEQDIQVKK